MSKYDINTMTKQGQHGQRLTTLHVKYAFRSSIVVLQTQVSCIFICIYNYVNSPSATK